VGAKQGVRDVDNEAEENAVNARTGAFKRKIWAQAIRASASTPTPITALFMASLNQVFDLATANRRNLQRGVPEYVVRLFGGCFDGLPVRCQSKAAIRNHVPTHAGVDTFDFADCGYRWCAQRDGSRQRGSIDMDNGELGRWRFVITARHRIGVCGLNVAGSSEAPYPIGVLPSSRVFRPHCRVRSLPSHKAE
jgi:hypothetical protein